MSYLEAGGYSRRNGAHNAWCVIDVTTGGKMRDVTRLDDKSREVTSYVRGGDGIIVVNATRKRAQQCTRRVRHIHLCRATKVALVLR